VYDNALDAAKKGELSNEMAEDLETLINQVIDNAKTTVHEMNSLAYNLETGAGE
jgi:hypothetical protein